MLAVCVLPVLLVGQFQRPLPPNEPPPQGQRIEAKDGDTVIIRGSARVRVVRRSEGTVRIVYNAAGKWIVVLYDFADPSGGAPDGKVDGSYRFEDVEGAWPLGERWQGSAVIDDYQMTQGMIRVGLGITTDNGLLQFFSGPPGPPAGNARWFQDSRAAAVIYYHSGGGGGTPSRMSFDEAEQFVTQQAARDAERRQLGIGNGFSSSVTMSASPASGGVVLTPGGSGPQPVRVGGNVRPPQKLVDVRPVYPADAQAARVTGVVIIEAIISTDGSVTDAKVLRSIPLLDKAALDAVKQWKFEPTNVNGVAVPVIMTVTVNFSLQ